MPDQADRLRQLAEERRARGFGRAVPAPSDPRPKGSDPQRPGEGARLAALRLAPDARRPTPDAHRPTPDAHRPTPDARRLAPALRLPAPPTRRARIIAVTSGKGGVGKTCVTVNLAIALADLGHRVIVIDLDLGLANVDVVADVRSRYNLYHVLTGRKALREVAVPGPGGIVIVPGASGIAQLADLAEGRRRDLIARFAELEDLADFILIDTAAGIGRNVIAFAQAADEVLVVTTPEPAAVTDAYAIVKTICRSPEHGELNLLVNMAAHAVQGRRVARRITSVAKQFLSVYIEEVGCVLVDEHVREAVARRQPFVLAFPKAPASADIHRVATHFGRQASRVSRPRGFFAKLAAALTGRHD
jgi:flagellar biosynthesis protein FlhG